MGCTGSYQGYSAIYGRADHLGVFGKSNAAVERKLEIIGEAIGQAVRYFPHIATRVDSCEQIIAFRNRLIHGYSTVSDRLVWEVIENHLPHLKVQSEDLLRDCEANPS